MAQVTPGPRTPSSRSHTARSLPKTASAPRLTQLPALSPMRHHEAHMDSRLAGLREEVGMPTGRDKRKIKPLQRFRNPLVTEFEDLVEQDTESLASSVIPRLGLSAAGGSPTLTAMFSGVLVHLWSMRSHADAALSFPAALSPGVEWERLSMTGPLASPLPRAHSQFVSTQSTLPVSDSDSSDDDLGLDATTEVGLEGTVRSGAPTPRSASGAALSSSRSTNGIRGPMIWTRLSPTRARRSSKSQFVSVELPQDEEGAHPILSPSFTIVFAVCLTLHTLGGCACAFTALFKTKCALMLCLARVCACCSGVPHQDAPGILLPHPCGEEGAVLPCVQGPGPKTGVGA